MDFETAYLTYPRHVAKEAARKAWFKLNGKRPPVEDMIAAIEKQKQSDQWKRDNGKYIPHFATWLNQHRWEDEVAEAFSLEKWAKEGT